MAITNTVSSNLLSAFIDCLDCFLLLPIRCDKVIEIVTSFLHKTLVTMYLHGTLNMRMSHTRYVHVYTPPPFLGVGVRLRLVAACRNNRNRNRDMYIICMFIRSATFNHQNTE